jgi:hypothetical protein
MPPNLMSIRNRLRASIDELEAQYADLRGTADSYNKWSSIFRSDNLDFDLK